MSGAETRGAKASAGHAAKAVKDSASARSAQEDGPAEREEDVTEPEEEDAMSSSLDREKVDPHTRLPLWWCCACTDVDDLA
eukprot:2297815-Rhodomonas_salina.2